MANSESSRNQPPLWFSVVWCLLTIALVLLLALLFPHTQGLQTALAVLIIILILAPYLRSIPDWFEEISGPGFKVKTRKDIQAVRRGQLLNKVVVVKETNQWLWVDESAIPHPLRDKEVVEFLSGQDGAATIRLEDLEKLESVVPEPMSPFESASLWHSNNRDFFILYEGTLYYQRSLAYVYKLAALKGFDFRGKALHKGEWEIVGELSPEQFTKYHIA